MDLTGEEEETCVQQRDDHGGGAEGTTNVPAVGVVPLVASRCVEEPGKGAGSPTTEKGEGETEGKARELELLLGWRQDPDPLASCAGSTLQSGPPQTRLAQERDDWASFPPVGHTECTSTHTTVAMGNGEVACSDLNLEHDEACNEEESSDVFHRTPSTADSAHRTSRFVYHGISMKSTSSDEFGDFDWQGPSVPSPVAPTVGIPLSEQWQLLCREIFLPLNAACQEGKQVVRGGGGGGCVSTPNALNKLAEESPLWREAVGDALKPRPELWSHPVIDSGFESALRTVCSQRQSQLQKLEEDKVNKDRVSISSCEDFDWSLEDASPFLLNLRELSLGNVSPETATMVAYLRSNVVSPVEVEMDVQQATAGLSLLSEEDIEAMIEEMQAKFSRLSQSLIDGLQEREELVQEREVRHKFIAAVHQLVQHHENLSSSPRSGTNLTVKELRRLASKKRSKEKSPVKYLPTVIPYTARPTRVPWNLDTLEKLTRILGAIQGNLDVVPALMREYLTECLELDLEGSNTQPPV